MAQVESRKRATSSEEARRAVLRRIEEEGVEFALLWFTDIEGHLKSFAITPSEIEDALDDGMGFDGSSISGFNAIEESDMVAIPDPETFQVMRWREGETKVARMICDVVTPDGKPYEGDPRYVLRRALERMRSLGFDRFNVGPELEYFLFKDADTTEPLEEGGLPRDLHAEAALRRERLRDAHAPVALHGRPERVLRRGRPLAPLRDGQGLHRRPAPARARDRGRLRAVGQLVQAARARLRGAGVRGLVAAEPLGADPDPALQAGLGAGDAGRDPLPRPRVQPVPHLRGAPARRLGGHRARLRAARADGDEPLPPDRRAAPRARDHLPAGDPRRGDRRAGRLGAGAEGARTAHLRPL